MDKFFKITERGSTVKTEIVAGITTFMAMAYILMVNSGMFAELGVVSYNAIYIATAISAIIGTVIIGLLANLPLAQASGMGLNAFFVYTVCFGFGLTYANALVLVLFDGIVFIILTTTGLRTKIFKAIPDSVRMAIPAGIGLFIAYIGLQNAGLIVSSESTASALASFNLFNGTATWADIMPLIVTILALLAIAVMSARKMKGAVIWGILGGAVCGTSTVTTFVESSAGVGEGGRTGLASMVTAALFFIAMFLSPVAVLIPSCATAAALIYVGVLMINGVKKIEWTDPEIAVPAFLTLAMMPFTYNISYGIAFGLISYIVIKLFTGNVKQINAGTWTIGILFLLMFFLTH